MKKLKSALHNIYGGPWWQRVLIWLSTFLFLLMLLLVAVDFNFLWLFGRSPGFRA